MVPGLKTQTVGLVISKVANLATALLVSALGTEQEVIIHMSDLGTVQRTMTGLSEKMGRKLCLLSGVLHVSPGISLPLHQNGFLFFSLSQ